MSHPSILYLHGLQANQYDIFKAVVTSIAWTLRQLLRHLQTQQQNNIVFYKPLSDRFGSNG